MAVGEGGMATDRGGWVDGCEGGREGVSTVF